MGRLSASWCGTRGGGRSVPGVAALATAGFGRVRTAGDGEEANPVLYCARRPSTSGVFCEIYGAAAVATQVSVKATGEFPGQDQRSQRKGPEFRPLEKMRTVSEASHFRSGRPEIGIRAKLGQLSTSAGWRRGRLPLEGIGSLRR